MKQLQDVFTESVGHMCNQGQQSLDEWGGVAYFGASGRKCTIGCFIIDELYCKKMEMLTPEKLIKRYPEAFEWSLSDTEVSMLKDLSYWHDNEFNSSIYALAQDGWIGAVVVIAEKYGVKVPSFVYSVHNRQLLEVKKLES